MRKTLIAATAAIGLALPGAAFAAGGAGEVTDVDFTFEGPFGSYDQFQLQRGFQVYQNVCSGCHGLKYLSFRELGDETGPNFPEEQVRAIAEMYEVEDPETGEMRTAKPSDKFPANNLMGAPDLTLMAKARAGFHGPAGLGINQLVKGIGGPEYIYSLLLAYTGKDIEQAGTILYENTAFSGGQYIAMAPPLYGQDVEYSVYGSDAETANYIPPEPTMEQEAKDVAAFLMWAAEPKMVERKEAGVRNLIMLIVLAVLLYFTNKKIWASVKGEH